MDRMQEKQRMLEELLSKWQEIYDNGASPGCEVSDGFLLNRIREDMQEILREMEREAGTVQTMYRDTIPEIVEVGYMARKNEIRRYAETVLKTVVQSREYQELMALNERLKTAGIGTKMGQPAGLAARLADAVEQDEPCLMRSLSQPDEIREQIEGELERLRELENRWRKRQKRKLCKGQISGQYSIYDLTA